MPLNVKNLDYIRQADQWTPDLGAKLAEAIQTIITAHNNVEQQTNANSSGPPQPPGRINGLQVTAKDGHFSVAIQDHNQIYRGVSYYIEHSADAQFSNPIVEHIGTTRNKTLFLGNVTRYFRAYSAYGPSAPNDPVYHGGAQPQAVTGGGAVGGPPEVGSQGSGTGPSGPVGMEGPGKIPFRSTNGIPPTR